MIGKTISHYKIIEKLGEGGMGVVYKAEDTKLDRFVALKFLPLHLSQSAEEKKRFIHEAKAASALDHNNICNIHEIDETDDGQIFIVMALYEGTTLKKKIDEGYFSIEEAIDIATQIATGLAKAHEKGIVHRDIKPANIMIIDDGVVKILDFGLAKLHGQSRLTKAGSTLGTAAYMSPEQAHGVEVDARTDIFALGAVFYEMLTGQIPFKGDYDQAVIYSLLNEEPQPIPEIRSHVPGNVENVVKKCLEKETDDRYQTASELLTDLTRGAAPKKLVTPKIRQRRQFMGLTLFSLAIVLAGIGYVSFFNKTPEPAERVPIAVVDFVNQTNEPELNGLSGMLITSLEQSRRLDVMSRARMFDELKQMGRQELTFIDESTGRAIAKNANIQALAVATIRKFDNLYTIDFKVMDPETGDHLFTANVQGEGQKSIPGMIDRLSEKTRIDLREQPRSVELASRGIADVTTTNLEAYQHYFKGEEYTNKLQFTNAEEEFKKAVAIDSTFGLAYYRLAYTISWTVGSAEQAKEPLQKALALIDRIPEKERYMLRALDARIERGFSPGIAILKEMAKLYPNDKEMLFNIGDYAYHAFQYSTSERYFQKVLNLDPTFERALQHLAWNYRNTGQHEKGIEVANRLIAVNERVGYEVMGQYYQNLGEHETAVNYLEKALELDSTSRSTLQELVRTYRSSGQYEKALEYANKNLSFRQSPFAYRLIAGTHREGGDLANALRWNQLGLEKFPKSPELLGRVARVYAYNREYDKAESQFKTMIKEDQPDGVRRSGFRELGLFYPYLGKYSEMMKMLDRHIEFHWSAQDSNMVALRVAEKAYWMYWGRRNKEEALAEIAKTIRFNNITNELYYTTLAELYADMGELGKARDAAENVRHPLAKLELEARTHYANGEWDQAIAKNEKLNQVNPWWLGSQVGFLSAQCYVQKGELDKAVNEIKKSQASYRFAHSFTYPQGFYLLGKIYEKKGDNQLAIQNYEKFLDLWKDADDPDLPDLIDAKKRLAKLKEMSNNGS